MGGDGVMDDPRDVKGAVGVWLGMGMGREGMGMRLTGLFFGRRFLFS